MRRSTICCTGALLVALLLVSSCAAPGQGPMTWIDRPLDGSHLPLGPITVMAHASDADGVASFEFFVDEDSLAAVPASGGRLGDATAGWTPTAPGTYTVRARATDSAGNVGSEATSVVTVGEVATPSPTFAAGGSEGEIFFLVEPEVIAPGACAVLRWEVYPPVDALLDGEGVPSAGEREVCPLETTTYELLVPEWEQASTVTVHVEAAPEEVGIFFAADPDAIPQGGCATLIWEVGAPAEWATLLEGSEVDHTGQQQVCPATTTTYELVVQAPDGSQTTSTVTLHVESSQEPTSTPEPTTAPAGPTPTSPPAGPTPTAPPAAPTPTPPPVPSATPSGTDLAITDLYAQSLYGPIWARITNRGPGTVTNVTVQLTCQWNMSISGRSLDSGQTGAIPIPIGSLSPGQTEAFNTDMSVDLHNDYQYDISCTIQVPFNDPSPGNNTHSETFTEDTPGGT
jgi:hypothetical protein